MRRSPSDPEPGDDELDDELEAPEPAAEGAADDGYFVIPVEVLERWRSSTAAGHAN